MPTASRAGRGLVDRLPDRPRLRHRPPCRWPNCRRVMATPTCRRRHRRTGRGAHRRRCRPTGAGTVATPRRGRHRHAATSIPRSPLSARSAARHGRGRSLHRGRLAGRRHWSPRCEIVDEEVVRFHGASNAQRAARSSPPWRAGRVHPLRRIDRLSGGWVADRRWRRRRRRDHPGGLVARLLHGTEREAAPQRGSLGATAWPTRCELFALLIDPDDSDGIASGTASGTAASPATRRCRRATLRG